MQVLKDLILDENNVAFHPMMGNSYQINETGTFIIEQLKQLQTADEITSILSNTYNIPQKELYIDVQDFITKLKIYGLT